MAALRKRSGREQILLAQTDRSLERQDPAAARALGMHRRTLQRKLAKRPPKG